MRTVMHAKIHKATVTEANLNYVGSITIDEDLLDAAGLWANEKVLVCLLYTSPSPRDVEESRMPSSA